MSRFQLLSDAQWSLIEDLLPVRTGKKGRPFRDARQVVEGIIYRYRCGIAWRDMPEAFGPWQTVWTWHRRLSAEGIWDVVLSRLLSAAEDAGSSTGPWRWIPRSRVRISTPRTSPATQGAGSNYNNPRVEPPDHGIGRSRGGFDQQDPPPRRRSRTTAGAVSPGQANDSPVFEHLLAHLKVARTSGGAPRTRPDRVRADKAYSSRAIRTELRRRGITAVIPEPSIKSLTANDAAPAGVGRRPSTQQITRAATSLNADSTPPNNGVAWPPATDKLATVYRGAAVLRAITLWLPHLSDTP